MIKLEAGFEGPYKAVCYDATLDDGRKIHVSGKQASVLSLILSGYVLPEGFHPFDAFEVFDAAGAPKRPFAQEK